MTILFSCSFFLFVVGSIPCNTEQSATVKVIDNSVRINFFNSNDGCAVAGQPVASGTGVGQATASVNLAAAVSMDVLFSGDGEQNYETLTVSINGVVAVKKQILGSDPLCTFQQICSASWQLFVCNNQVVTVAMPAGSNTIVVHGTTVDAIAHRNAFFAVSFVPQATSEDCTKCNGT